MMKNMRMSLFCVSLWKLCRTKPKNYSNLSTCDNTEKQECFWLAVLSSFNNTKPVLSGPFHHFTNAKSSENLQKQAFTLTACLEMMCIVKKCYTNRKDLTRFHTRYCAFISRHGATKMTVRTCGKHSQTGLRYCLFKVISSR